MLNRISQLISYVFRVICHTLNRSDFVAKDVATFRFVVATRAMESRFWLDTPLGRTCAELRHHPRSVWAVHYKNKKGLGELYAVELEKATEDFVVFLHDDIWVLEENFLDAIHSALAMTDIVGVAGTRKRHSRQPAWLFSSVSTKSGFKWDHPNLSGGVYHGTQQHHEYSEYGPFGARCRFLDGVFLAINRQRVQKARVNFSSKFLFHFYDMDFCRSADQKGLIMKTAPLQLVHQSTGSFGTSDWWHAYQTYLSIWKD